MSSSPPEPPRHGLVAWLVFVAAILVVLTITAGCTVMMYAPAFG
ncbi:hypothetical protein [Actinorugispora endophytica]|uniref:Uncharacterized protein n=1 Tax=Actinorugispora endophytica TaxID=1605990 RepID=A0A4R6V1F7_9ACTN|nr:hypothetical protein [Actinorugispora endophytica]TDQ52401.1 hypothetical protein EV190_10639 [Actinorugispora endophytica]